MDNDEPEPWFDNQFPPLSIYYGGRDFLVLTEPLLERIKKVEKHVDLLRVERIDLAEVCICLFLRLNQGLVS